MTVNIPVWTDSGFVKYNPVTFNTATNWTRSIGNVQFHTGNHCIRPCWIRSMSALGGLFDWTLPVGTVFDFNRGLQWAVAENAKINGQVVTDLGAGLVAGVYWYGNTIIMEGGFTSVAEQQGYLEVAAWSAFDGHLMWITNRTGGIENPAYTRISNTPAGCDGVYCETNHDSYQARRILASHRQTTLDNQPQRENV